MKKLILIIVTIFSVNSAFAQDIKTEEKATGITVSTYSKDKKTPKAAKAEAEAKAAKADVKAKTKALEDAKKAKVKAEEKADAANLKAAVEANK